GRRHQPHAQDAPDHGRCDEGDGLGQARTTGRPRRHAGAGLRHAEPRTDAGARQEDAGWHAWRNAWRPSANDARHARAATEVSRPAWWEEEMMRALTRRVGTGAGTALRHGEDSRAPCPPAALMQAASLMVGKGAREPPILLNAVPAPVPTLQACELTNATERKSECL